ncbi:nuclear transport factor 2 isoform X2 [Rhodamnia argentea]|uniref:Nuclear transport factor 2 isoform X2 n=1 Tax=Rhodamnia argentea TaxID=178133 RepID=A0A8B8NG06_9MYRT|nr:nuclear transport factor 2 isoform X2 [Rhodamnia argentea]
MAVQERGSVPTPSAQVVGNAFVEQYYHILHQSPGLVHRFYQDSSFLSRPDVSGNITTVTTTQAINKKILSLNYEDFTAEIETADAQESYGKGVIVLVTGCLTGKDHVRRKFTQTFFLAPQEKGYFVLNDVFRFLEENEPLPMNSTANNGTSNATATAALPPEQEHAKVPDELAAKPLTPSEEEQLNNGPGILNPSGNEESVIEDRAVESTPHQIDSSCASEEDAPKKSYASIVKVMQGHAVTGKIFVPSKTERTSPPPASDTQQLSVKSSVVTPNPSTDIAPESSNVHEEEGHSIFIGNLAFDATVEQLEEEFKKFGPIKSNGIQVRSSKQGSCFGFIEFETSSSMQSALKASPVTIGDHQAVIEEKRTTTRGEMHGYSQVANSGRGRYSLGRGGFRSDSFRGRGSFGGGRGYGRNDFRNQGEFSGRPRGPMGRGGDGYQRAYQNGNANDSREGANRMTGAA